MDLENYCKKAPRIWLCGVTCNRGQSIDAYEQQTMCNSIVRELSHRAQQSTNQRHLCYKQQQCESSTMAFASTSCLPLLTSTLASGLRSGAMIPPPPLGRSNSIVATLCFMCDTYMCLRVPMSMPSALYTLFVRRGLVAFHHPRSIARRMLQRQAQQSRATPLIFFLRHGGPRREYLVYLVYGTMCTLTTSLSGADTLPCKIPQDRGQSKEKCTTVVVVCRVECRVPHRHKTRMDQRT